MPIYKGNTLMSGGGNWFKAFPNWAARQIQSAGVTYTAKSYGYVLFRNVNYTDTCSGYINGAKVFNQHGSYGNFEDWNSCVFPINPGTTYRLDGGEVSFIPAIGA